MSVLGSVRRWGVSAVGIVGVVALTAGCSSTSAGKPVAPKSTASVSSAGLSSGAGGSLPVTVPSSLPVSLPTSLGASVPNLSGSQFCKDFSGQGNLTNILSGGTGSALDKYLSAWDKLVAEAPSEIKSDISAVSDYLHAAVKGNVDPNAASKLTTAYTNIGTYIATHCH